MTPDDLFDWIKVAAFIAGLVFGGFAVGSTSWVWLKRNLISVAACWLATLGTVMIGMSIWQSLEVSGPGWKAKFDTIASQNRDLKRMNDVLAARVDTLYQEASVTKRQFDALEAHVASVKAVDFQKLIEREIAKRIVVDGNVSPVPATNKRFRLELSPPMDSGTRQLRIEVPAPTEEKDNDGSKPSE